MYVSIKPMSVEACCVCLDDTKTVTKRTCDTCHAYWYTCEGCDADMLAHSNVRCIISKCGLVPTRTSVVDSTPSVTSTTGPPFDIDEIWQLISYVIGKVFFVVITIIWIAAILAISGGFCVQFRCVQTNMGGIPCILCMVFSPVVLFAWFFLVIVHNCPVGTWSPHTRLWLCLIVIVTAFLANMFRPQHGAHDSLHYDGISIILISIIGTMFYFSSMYSEAECSQMDFDTDDDGVSMSEDEFV